MFDITNFIGTGIYLTHNDGTPAEITNVSVTVDGVTYTEGEVIITPDTQSIIYTVTGTNFVNLRNNNLLHYVAGIANPLASEFFVIDTKANTATMDATSEFFRFEACNNFEVAYSNAGASSWIGTGIYLTYNDGTPAEITGVSVTVDGVTYTEGEVTITPDTQSIIFTVNGTNFVNLSDSNLLAYANSMPVTEAFDWAINAADGTATKDFTSLLSNFAICNNFEVMYSNEDGANWIGTGIYLTYGVPTSDLDGKIAISMTDSCGDTWNGNAIEVYENSVLVATVTLTEGTSGTWTRKYDPE